MPFVGHQPAKGFYREIGRGTMTTTALWEPLCMEPSEWTDWQRLNPMTIAERVERPCADCPLDYAINMRKIRRCNGWPGQLPSNQTAIEAPDFYAPGSASIRSRGTLAVVGEKGDRGSMTEERTSNEDRTAKLLRENAEEALRFQAKAFRGAIDLDNDANRRLLAASGNAISSWTRYQQTQSAREQTRVTLAAMMADSDGANRSEYIRLSMPNHSIVRLLPAPSEPKQVS